MTRPLSNDLRERVVAAVTGGESCRAAAARSKACSAFSTWVDSDTLMKTLTDRPTARASTCAA